MEYELSDKLIYGQQLVLAPFGAAEKMVSTEQVVDAVGIGLYGGQLVLLLGLVVWLFSIRCFHSVGRVMRTITYTSPKVVFTLICIPFIIGESTSSSEAFIE
jgi:hypothetical protein